MIVAALLLAAAAPAPDWEGTWEGTLINLPARPGAPDVRVTVEFGAWPTKAGDCATWRNTYREGGKVKGVKDYRLCRGDDPDDLYVDEGDGVKLTARLLGDVLVSPFKYDDHLLVTTTRVDGAVMTEEIFSIADKPAIKGVQPLVARSIQRLVLRRISPRPPK